MNLNTCEINTYFEDSRVSPRGFNFFHSDSSFKVSYFSFWNFWPNFVQEIRRHSTRDLFDQASRRRVDRSFTFVGLEFWTSMARVYVSFFFHHFLLGTSKNELDRVGTWNDQVLSVICGKKRFPFADCPEWLLVSKSFMLQKISFTYFTRSSNSSNTRETIYGLATPLHQTIN